MTKTQIRQMTKGEAFNRIRKIYHPLHRFHYDQYSGESYAEQRDGEVRMILEEMEDKLKKLHNDNK